MKYREIEYTVARGVGRQWEWSTTTIAGVMVMGRVYNEAAGVAAAEKAIDKALVVAKMQPIPSERPD